MKGLPPSEQLDQVSLYAEQEAGVTRHVQHQTSCWVPNVPCQQQGGRRRSFRVLLGSVIHQQHVANNVTTPSHIDVVHKTMATYALVSARLLCKLLLMSHAMAST